MDLLIIGSKKPPEKTSKSVFRQEIPELRKYRYFWLIQNHFRYGKETKTHLCS